jgi:Undecaprenyl-phosphate glucose phosphotransferase
MILEDVTSRSYERTIQGVAEGNHLLTQVLVPFSPLKFLLRTALRWVVSYRGVVSLVLSLDAVLIVLTATIANLSYHYMAFGGSGTALPGLPSSLFVATSFVFLAKRRKLYEPPQLLAWVNQFRNVLMIWCRALLLLGGFIFLLGIGKDTSRGAILLFAAVGLPVLLAHRLFWRVVISGALARGWLHGCDVILLGWSLPDRRIVASLPQHGFRVVRQFILETSSPAATETVLSDIISFVRGSDIEEIFLLGNTEQLAEAGKILLGLRALPIPVTMVADDAIAELVRSSWYQLDRSVAIEAQRSPLSKVEQTCKRAVDMVAALCGLILLLPLLIISSIAIKLDSPGPIFFRQTRLGFNGKPFKIFKFRSMAVLEDGDVIKQATRGDQRVTRVGGLLRRSSIDEIPQLINVLRGEMSIVGPRPHALAHDNKYFRLIDNYAYRHHVKPGLTGWAQIHGCRGETRDLDQMQRRVDLDLWYINNWTLWLDIVIILHTFGEVARGRNAY